MEVILEDTIACLQQGTRLLRQLSPESYNFKSLDTLNSTVGAHFRHNVDHYRSFIRGISQGRVDYDDRERDPHLETDPPTALARVEGLIGEIRRLHHSDLDRRLQVKMDCGSETLTPWSESTGRREVQFLLSHTVHHYALIAIICRMQGIEPEETFGVAPSTLRFREHAAAAASPACAH